MSGRWPPSRLVTRPDESARVVVKRFHPRGSRGDSATLIRRIVLSMISMCSMVNPNPASAFSEQIA
jgi:hypothetical protein